MSEHWEIYADWNPWHGCTKISPGCKYCYVYRQDEMYGSEISSQECRKTGNFNLPIKRKRDKSWIIPSGRLFFHQTGARFIKDGKMYRIRRCYQLSQAHKANIDYKIGKYMVPETVKFQWSDDDYHE